MQLKLTTISAFFVVLLASIFLFILIWGFKCVNLKDIFELFKDKEFVAAVVFGFKTSGLAAVFSFIFGVPSGYFLARSNSNLSRFLDVFFDIPLIIPPLIVGVLLLDLFNANFVKNFYDFVFTFYGAATAQFLIAFPFSVKSSKTAFELIPPVYERIAMTLGAGRFRSFYDTTFKLAFSGILSGLILSWLRSLGEFGATLLVGGGIAFKTENIPINIYINISEGNFKKALAASLLVIILSFFSVFLIKFLNRRFKV
ncbi:ABC transporter permease [Hippea jasoniae]|uniref:ABC transporter permease n=1 Tax=Hippea jasoniae TaxID=944479 RepID=UPI0005554BA4|nr:ABC transporter permease subunit [Hippea jasoniae]